MSCVEDEAADLWGDASRIVVAGHAAATLLPGVISDVTSIAAFAAVR